VRIQPLIVLTVVDVVWGAAVHLGFHFSADGTSLPCDLKPGNKSLAKGGSDERTFYKYISAGFDKYRRSVWYGFNDAGCNWNGGRNNGAATCRSG
jgi:hypothetical protein